MINRRAVMQEMAADQISNANAPGERSPEEDCISSAIESLRVIKRPWFQRPHCILLIALIAKIALDVTLNGAYAIDHNAVLELIARNAMYGTIAVNIILFIQLIQSIPPVLENLWDRGIVRGFSEDIDYVNATKDRQKRIEQYCAFMKEFKEALNSRRCQIFVGTVLALMVLTRSFYEFWSWLPRDFWMGLIYLAGGHVALIEGIKLHLWVFLTQYSSEDPLGFFSGVILDPLLGFFLGLMAWKMLITGRYIGFLNERFRLDPQMQHPDGHGGLGCLGKIYLLNASLIGIWGVLLCGWLVLGQVIENADFSRPLVVEMLAFFVVITPLSFLFPVWGFHKLMQKKKEIIIKSLDHQISEAFIQKANPTMRPERINELKRIKEAYDQASGFSVWPFGKMALVGIAFSQTLTYIGMLVSFYKMLDLIYIVAQELILWQ
ncbi:MAG: hypothetical protein E4G89_00090 [Methanothrix sp.]|nr:MAG: hypothetical protein E4G89_00090 [Methanothrix sp.]